MKETKVNAQQNNQRASSSASGKHAAESSPDIIILDWNEWATKVVPAREKLIVPIIPEKGLVEIYAPRGVGKTFLSLGIAIAVATGTDFLRWAVPRPRRVLYVDGEMAFIDLQERAKWMVAGLRVPPQTGFLRLYAADLQAHGIPDLASEKPEGRDGIEKALKLGEPDQVELLILDNLSTLTNTGSENSDEAWAFMQEWLLKLRRQGVSVVFVHHAGKGGKQRGTSKREDALDTVIKLSNPDGYQPTEGARFVISYEKQRGFFGKDAEPSEARFFVQDGVGSWETRPAGKRAEIEQVADLIASGNSYREIQAKTGMSKSKVGRLSGEARNLDRLVEAGDAGTIIHDSTTSH
ncbi:AAA family ATPase [Mesorhizobium sp. B2-4-19]|uniref:ATP-binding protein n=1 Tax=Mesorhizobium sp. B2-4-19 TaxID=2589930 RepID=UPI00112BA2B7|nr:AAA family ATPase [Mesorhizobium sp. B2-4-19]TPK57340.1 AAA family ATPase [Mesorhizobium sp. B2-4-19]